MPETVTTTPPAEGTALPSEPLDLHQAGDLLSSLLSDEPPKRPRGSDGKFIPKAPPATPEPDAEEGDEGNEAPPPPEAEGEEPDAEGQEGEEKAPEPPKAPEPRVLKVKVDGMEQELPEEEVVKGYSRMADYTRKTQALAEERRRFEEAEVAPVREERRYYAERLAQLEEAIQTLAPEKEPDWNALRSTATPEEFTAQFAQWQAHRQRTERIRAEQERVQERIREEEARQFRATVERERTKLRELYPEWADPEKEKAHVADLSAYAKSLGFTDDDLAHVTDHRVVALLDKARRFDEAERRKPKLVEKIDRALDTIKPSAATSPPRRSAADRALQQVRQTGRLEDAAAAINSLLG